MPMDRLMLREKFARRVEKFRLDDYGIEVFVRPLSALERAKIVDKYASIFGNKEAKPSLETITIEAQCFIVCRGLVDENGKRLYADDEAEKLAEEFFCQDLDLISKRIMALSGMDKPAEDQLKNSNPTTNADSSYVLQ